MFDTQDRTNIKLSAQTRPWEDVVPDWTWDEWWLTFDPPNITDFMYQTIKVSTKISSEK